MSHDVIFVPGVILPARLRYAALVEQLPDANAKVLELALYAGDAPPPGYSVATEVDAISAAADREGFARFHLYGHSGGGACALAFAAAHPERLLSLAVDEPATDFTDEDLADPYWDEIAAAQAMSPPAASVAAFLRLQLAPGVEPPPPPTGPAPAWMAQRPAGIVALAAALRRQRISAAQYRAVRAPVLFTLGSLSHPRWFAMRDRLARLLPAFRSELFAGLHHFKTSHQAEPARTAALLRELWTTA